MFGELPKLFGRNFATGYFLPMTIFLAASLYLANEIGLASDLVNQLQSNLLVGTTILGLLSWICGVGLLVVNRDIIRLMEGYGKYNPARILLRFQKSRYDQITKELKEIDEIREKLPDGEGLPTEKLYRRMDLMLELASHYPDDPHWLLPTSFGNTIRAFEVYSRVMYGIEAIIGWERLLAIIPKDYRELIDSAKARTDFWVNLGFLSLVFIAEYVCLSIYSRQLMLSWLLIVAVVLSFIAYNRALSSVVEWGEMVKASFDIFLPELQKKLELRKVDSKENGIAMWTRFSQAVLYRLPGAMPKEPPHKEEAQETVSNES